MKFGCPVWYGDLRQIGIGKLLGIISDYGFDYIELSADFPVLENLDKKNFKTLLRKNNLGIAFHSPLGDAALLNPRGTIRSATVKLLADCMEFARYFDPLYFNFHVLGGEPSTIRFDEVSAECVKAGIQSCQEITNIAKSKCVPVTLENHPSHLFGFPNELQTVLKKVRGLGFCFDYGHFMLLNGMFKGNKRFKKINLQETAKMFSGCMVSHIHDYRKKYNEDHLPIGTGELDIKKIFKTLNSEYNLIEVFKDKDTGKNLKAIKKGMDFLKKGV